MLTKAGFLCLDDLLTFAHLQLDYAEQHFQIKRMEPDAAMKPDPMSPGTYVVVPEVSTPVVLYMLDPDYSDQARKARLEGTVVLRLTVEKTGIPANIKVMRGLGMGLDEKAVEAVKQWKFRPASRNGAALAFETTVEVNFRL